MYLKIGAVFFNFYLLKTPVIPLVTNHEKGFNGHNPKILSSFSCLFQKCCFIFVAMMRATISTYFFFYSYYYFRSKPGGK